MRLAAALALLALAACAGAPAPPELVGHYVSEFELDPEASPREVLAQACLSDWCPLLKQAIAAELGCPQGRETRPIGRPWKSYPRPRLASPRSP